MKRVIVPLIIICILSCKKDSPIFETDDNPVKCYIHFDSCVNDDVMPVSSSGFGTGPDFTFTNPYYLYPYFNPNNPNEIIYCTNYQVTQLYKYNRVTKQKQLLITADILSAPRWGKNGWILFSDGQILGIKDNGDSLTKIPFGENCFNPEWNYDGTKFLYETFSPVSRIQNFYTKELDSIRFDIEGGDWQNTKGLCICFTINPSRGYTVIDMNTKKITPFFLADIYTNGSEPIWVNEHLFIFYSQNRIYLFDINNSAIKLIGETCSNDVLGTGSYSRSTNELMYSIDHWKYIGNNTIQITSRIIIINLNTGQLQTLALNGWVQSAKFVKD